MQPCCHSSSTISSHNQWPANSRRTSGWVDSRARPPIRAGATIELYSPQRGCYGRVQSCSRPRGGWMIHPIRDGALRGFIAAAALFASIGIAGSARAADSFVAVRERPGAAAGAVARRHAAVRGQHAGQSPGDLRGRRRRPDARPARFRSAWSRSRSRRAPTPRCGWSTISPTASASSTSAATPPHVIRTLLVGDEPRDIVFAGPGGEPRLHHHGAPRPERAGVDACRC